jgi:predicted O-methyltransferase YrrM
VRKRNFREELEMSKKIMLAVAAVVMLAGVASLIAQKTDNVPDVMQTQRQRKAMDSPDPDTLAGQERPPIPNSEQEKRILSVLEDMCQGQHSGILSVPPEDGRVLRLLTEATGAEHVVEIGTSNGYAAIWFCLALRTTGGRLTTYEIDTLRASLARENFKRAGVDKLVTLIEGDAHKAVKRLKGPIDIVFIDADKDGYLDYLNKLLPLVRPGGLILAHNTTNVASQMQGYLKAITTNPELETIFLHKQGGGIGVTLKKRQGE